MHINDTHHAQAIALLHEVCEAMGIEQENRTRDEVRKRLGWIENTGTNEIGCLVVEMAENCDCVTSANAYFDHDGQTYYVSVREGVRGDENDE